MQTHIVDDDLAAYADGETDAVATREIDQHLAACPSCRRQLAALRQADAGLREMAGSAAPAGAVMAAWQAVSAELTPAALPEVLTLEQAAGMLAVSMNELAEVMDELPLFEIAGQLRIRRARLVEWIADRERQFSRQRSQSWVARASAGMGKGVA